LQGGGPDKRCYRVTCDKIRPVLPTFRPEWTASNCAQELYDAYRAVGLTAEDMERGRYVRISEIQRLQKAGQLDGTLRWCSQRAETPLLASTDPILKATVEASWHGSSARET